MQRRNKTWPGCWWVGGGGGEEEMHKLTCSIFVGLLSSGDGWECDRAAGDISTHRDSLRHPKFPDQVWQSPRTNAGAFLWHLWWCWKQGWCRHLHTHTHMHTHKVLVSSEFLSFIWLVAFENSGKFVWSDLLILSLGDCDWVFLESCVSIHIVT